MWIILIMTIKERILETFLWTAIPATLMYGLIRLVNAVNENAKALNTYEEVGLSALVGIAMGLTTLAGSRK